MGYMDQESFGMFKKGVVNKTKQRRQQTLEINEIALQRQIILYLKAIGSVAGKTKTIGLAVSKDSHAFYRKDSNLMTGKADIECFHKGVMYCIEVKSKHGRQSPEQKEYQKVFHKWPTRIYILARKLEDVSSVIK